MMAAVLQASELQGAAKVPFLQSLQLLLNHPNTDVNFKDKVSCFMLLIRPLLNGGGTERMDRDDVGLRAQRPRLPGHAALACQN